MKRQSHIFKGAERKPQGRSGGAVKDRRRLSKKGNVSLLPWKNNIATQHHQHQLRSALESYQGYDVKV